MPKYGVTISFIETAYKEVEADSEQEAEEIVANMDTSEYEPLGDDDIEYMVEEL